ncbi:N-formylglutamate amidohydrolase [Sphingomonas sp. PL-96]|uniref:N-formylglutamate amidohydrolase n=1 Tax=Sphingomonas sp. PL-96 TaxID=2887201 RepID=UPI001E477CD3|nr:N-formylglutamate amidohydrolase [Sphingomonas sp. PL-96]MCC2977816.1 N-formylglutamate amidohydrolase [Sphingomonas sp. PL-96]
MTPLPQPFDRHGLEAPVTPVVLSAPHAGRIYPEAMQELLRLPVAALMPLEDRLVDQLAIAARGPHTLFVATLARAWIDLNRGEHERDPRIDAGADPMAQPQASLRLRSGLGLVPRRAGAAGDVWKRKLTAEEVSARIVAHHRPYHAAVAAALAAARARFGIAILLDIHSMPTLPGVAPAQLVLGDRHGHSAARPLVTALENAARESGLRVVRNQPYAGGHVVATHGAPNRNVHAIQIEFDRSLYLDPTLTGIGPGLAPLAAMLSRMIAAVVETVTPTALAAE